LYRQIDEEEKSVEFKNCKNKKYVW
jgi:hypothetical protein